MKTAVLAGLVSLVLSANANQNEDLLGCLTPQAESIAEFSQSVSCEGSNLDIAKRIFNKLEEEIIVLPRYDTSDSKNSCIVHSKEIYREPQSPKETLETGQGSYLDLNTLYASLLENLGIDTAFMLGPNNSVATMFEVENDESNTIQYLGKSWTPVCPQSVGMEFEEAVSCGYGIYTFYTVSEGKLKAEHADIIDN